MEADTWIFTSRREKNRSPNHLAVLKVQAGKRKKNSARPNPSIYLDLGLYTRRQYYKYHIFELGFWPFILIQWVRSKLGPGPVSLQLGLEGLRPSLSHFQPNRMYNFATQFTYSQ